MSVSHKGRKMQSLTKLDELDSEKISIVKFGAEWCPTCRQLQTKLEEIKDNYKDLDFWELNVDNHLDLADEYKVNELPVVIAFKKGKEISRWVESVGDITDWLKFLTIF